jgi:hypothetical protein
LANICFLSPYLFFICLLKCQQATNPAILIREQQNTGEKRQKPTVQCACPTLLVGKGLGLTAYAVLLAMTILSWAAAAVLASPHACRYLCWHCFIMPTACRWWDFIALAIKPVFAAPVAALDKC